MLIVLYVMKDPHLGAQYLTYLTVPNFFWKTQLEGFLRYEFGGLIFGGAYTWRGLFSKFYGRFFTTTNKYEEF